MRIGITVHFQHSFFSSGSPQTALSVAESYRLQGHTVFFINTEGDEKWWDDVKGVGAEWTSVNRKDFDLSGACIGDLSIEIGSHYLKPAERACFKKSVWLCKKPMIFRDIEASLFPFETPDRNMDGISEVWLLKEHTNSDDIQYAELLTRKPVRLLPFTWTPTAIELYRQETKAPVWQQVSQLEEAKGRPWSIHICETNTSSASSSTIPLLIMREVKLKTKTPLSPVVKIHNAESIKQTEFFRFNVLSHVFSDIKDMSGTFIGRQRVVDFVYDPYSIIIAHSRFINIRHYLLDALWVGIPLVHNSVFLKELNMGNYYEDNEISQGKEAFINAVSSLSTTENLIENRKILLNRLTPLSTSIQLEWDSAAKAVLKDTKASDAKAKASDANASDANANAKAKATLRIGFSDMWDGFNPEYNQFTLMLEAAGVCKIVGVQYKEGVLVDLLIFGPFGDTWKSATVPKVHYTGENTEPIQDAKLNIGFQHRMFNDGSYLRLPLWMLEINWFRGDAERIGNPKPISIDRCCKVYEEVEREKFCAFVVTNPCQPMRNAAFQWLSEYKNIDSAGRLFNNMGDTIFAGLGGGGGELKKMQFLKKYKFCLSYENASSPGYTTEKYLHAKASGCIPIYWGDPKVERDFDMNGCIDARHVKTSGELISLVKEVDTNRDLWLRKFSVPALDDVRRDTVRRTLSECARRILSLVMDEKDLCIPPMIGFTEDGNSGECNELITHTPALEDTVIITGCNAKFLPSLILWLRVNGQHKNTMKSLQYIIYLMEDIDVKLEQQLIEDFPFIQTKRFPSNVPEDFKDLWAPEHFAWKIWILNEANTLFQGKTILYVDTGAVIARFPWDWLDIVKKHGMCVLEDPREFNKYRCHENFIKAMNVTKEELEANQIWAGSIAFIAGAALPVKIMNEAWMWAQKRDVIAGPKWTGQVIDGHYFGHRHDQSILSILCKRGKCIAYPLDEVYCDVSLRHTYTMKKSIYCHRGMFKIHEKLLPEIDEAWVINLDRRNDRLEKFKNTHKDLARQLLRLSAFEGTKINLTPKIARLFAPNDFKWKKAVMGCAMSHLALWMQLVNDKPEINSYLILEDDARLDPSWQRVWEKADEEKEIPNDWDVIYLGGILPPNRDAFEMYGVEKVNTYFSRVKENTIFGQQNPNRYFHFCAYSYVLTRRGAKKILDFLESRNGYWTSADHMICNIHEFLNIYFIHPLLAGCYQDDDEVYKTSKFNDFSRVDKFDSDLWNNNEHFSEETVAGVLDMTAPIDIIGALEDARLSASTKDASTPYKVPSISTMNLVLPNLGKRRIVSFFDTDSSKWHEYGWLKQIFEPLDISINVEKISGDVVGDEPIVFVQRPHVEHIRSILAKWNALGCKFYILHMSDEYGSDSIDFYTWPCCLGVIRNYVRPDVKESDSIRIMPLGFHWSVGDGQVEKHTPRPAFREYAWSFVGTGWMGRAEKLKNLEAIPRQHKCVLMEDWNSPNMLCREETLSILLNTWCVPCPSGQNSETFRFYEALEAGAVPMLVKEDVPELYFQFLGKWLPLLIANDWKHAAELIHTLREKPEIYEQYRSNLLAAWDSMKKDVRNFVKGVFRV